MTPAPASRAPGSAKYWPHDIADGRRKTLHVVAGDRRHGWRKMARKHCVDFGTYKEGKGKNAREVVNTVYTDRNSRQTKMLGTHLRGQALNGQPSNTSYRKIRRKCQGESFGRGPLRDSGLSGVGAAIRRGRLHQGHHGQRRTSPPQPPGRRMPATDRPHDAGRRQRRGQQGRREEPPKGPPRQDCGGHDRRRAPRPRDAPPRAGGGNAEAGMARVCKRCGLDPEVARTMADPSNGR